MIYKFIASNHTPLSNCGDLGLPNCGESANDNIGNVLTVVFMVTGFLSILFILIGAFKLITSGGSPEGVKAARETILYAIIGLIVSAASFGIVQFVLGSL